MLDSAVPAVPGNRELEGNIEGAKELILTAKAGNTTLTYLSHIRGFRSWAESRGVVWLPASRSTILGYFGFLQKLGASRSLISGSQAAINWVHRIGGLDSWSGDSLVSLYVQGALRSAKIPAQTSAFSKSSLEICLRTLRQNSTFTELRLAALLIL